MPRPFRKLASLAAGFSHAPARSHSNNLLRVVALAITLVLACGGTSPVDAITPPGIDAEITSAVAAVSPDSLRATVMALQGFFTRHTNSDTLSSTVGIGAARRWVYDQFVRISNDTGGRLEVEFDTFTTTVQGISRAHRNVVATLPGSDPSAADRVFVITGHLDSRNGNANDVTGFAAGANDDGSGVSAVIEAARVLSAMQFEATIKFVAFTGEEQGLVGSTHYASQAAAYGVNIEANLNNDIIGSVFDGNAQDGDSIAFDSTHVRMFSVGPEFSSSRQASRLFEIYGEAYEPAMDITLVPAQDRPGRGGDHIAFNNYGFCAIRLTDTFDNMLHQHAVGDTFQIMNFPYCARNVRLNVAALGNLARAPRLVEGVTASDIGDSTGFNVAWLANAEADVAGYRVTTRSPGVLQYETAADVGAVLSHAIAAPANDSLFIGVAAYDADGHLGLAVETLAILSSVPLAPAGVTVSPDRTTIVVDWYDSPAQDLDGYHIYRATTEAGPFTRLNATPLSNSVYIDATAMEEQFYYYQVTVVDLAANESPFSDTARGRLVSLSRPLLLVDETASIGGAPHQPTEAQADSFYATALQDFPHDVIEYDSAAAATGITLSDIGAYSTVIWVSDDRNAVFLGITVIHKHLGEFASVLQEYLDLGGRVLVMGWQETGDLNSTYPITLGPGDFLYDYFRVGAVGLPGGGQHFWGAAGALGNPSVIVDTTKTRPMWIGKLPDVEYITAIAPGGVASYTYRAASADSAFNNAAVGVRYDAGTFRTQFLDFPLWHLRADDARALVQSVMQFFPDLTGVPDDGPAGGSSAARFVLRSSPNPAPGGAALSFSLARDTEIELAIYSTSGERVRVVEKGLRRAGRHRIVWDGRDQSGSRVASGVYVSRLTAGDLEAKKKLVILR
ncbi:MAG: M28 family peptidase [bacterium]